MKSMTLYVERNSLIHHIDPLTKLLYVFVSIAATYIIPDLRAAIITTFISILLLLIGKVFRKILPILGVSFFLILSIIIVQGLFHPNRSTPLVEIGGFTIYKEGISYACLLVLRIFNMLCAFGLLILTTEPDELIDSLVKKGMSRKIGYVFLSVLQIIPQMRATMGKIIDAQRSRGMETEGHILVRLKSFFPLIGPVVLNSLNDTKERAIALEVRGFNAKGKKTHFKKARKYSYSRSLKCILLLAFILIIVGRLTI
ncbi:energy-coupling factor transporter transmembrane protein EcfT [Heyndrickxia oleronia]|uniref:energy-coupling factor transporter transmembrane component T family protein n=1 Tax=Heyndrickxia oleronia TaxID=38875 RepID=UPI0033384208